MESLTSCAARIITRLRSFSGRNVSYNEVDPDDEAQPPGSLEDMLAAMLDDAESIKFYKAFMDPPPPKPPKPPDGGPKPPLDPEYVSDEESERNSDTELVGGGGLPAPDDAANYLARIREILIRLGL